MTTVIKIKKTSKIVRFITQQYITGLYVAVYTDGHRLPDQSVSKMEQVKFHRKLRKDIAKHKDIFLKNESDPLNAKEVLDLQNQFALAYCEKKGWPCKNDKDELSFRGLSKRRINILKALPEVTAARDRLRW
jgi:hypothetical protein